VRSEDVPSPQIQEDALFDLAVLAVALDEAEVLVEGAFFGFDLDATEIHGRDSLSRPILAP
jgi:hypothetical protein